MQLSHPSLLGESDVDQRHEDTAAKVYQARTDYETSLDPIECAILDVQQAQHLLTFYFANLRPWVHLLDPRLHTLQYIRTKSPFLLTAVSLVASYFSDHHRHLSHYLSIHADSLFLRVVKDGYRSLEIAQALCILAAWAPAKQDGDTERSWTLLGLAA